MAWWDRMFGRQRATPGFYGVCGECRHDWREHHPVQGCGECGYEREHDEPGAPGAVCAARAPGPTFP
ncbi:hypothetical protein GCM10010168_64420 [Actinoplanes ianthinogenes]|uniref:Uncharacterized protein n=1 Tax=Actinoplanes ianthinogenes TaxID=122358 RepID=A0ABM7MA55_9ACTN|nr:hypothetical protein [Actinoplanes ianthinogenes]BCJ48493.1 hypothetical protein Aiant_91500 [Actinoplanes ianthinogenes]GGR37002.1 hypothetical protein GCM10010168_64420 [Actinoplanes ianthinogenes]